MSSLTSHPLIDRLSGLSPESAVAVIGDISLDVRLTRTGSYEQSVQGAAQVALYCKSLGIETVDLYAVVADDGPARELAYQLTLGGVGTANLMVQRERWTTSIHHTFTTPDKSTIRCESGSANALGDKTASSLLSDVSGRQTPYDCIVLFRSQNSPLFTDSFIAGLVDGVNHTPLVVYGFGSDHHFDGAYTVMSGEDYEKGRIRHSPLFVVSTDDGALCFDGEETYREHGFHLIKEADHRGSIEAFLAGCALAVINGASSADVLKIATLSLGVAIQPYNYPQGVTVSSIKELAPTTQRRYAPTLAHDRRLATYLEGTEIEIIEPAPQRGSYPVAAIFDLDGTLSVLREGWEPVMRDAMVRFITGDAYDTLSLEPLQQIERQVDRVIERTTGVQTVIQMVEMMHLQELYDFVPVDERATAHQYKDWYAQRIRARVEAKFARFEARELGVGEFTILGALPFLTHLRSKGVRLYLASGTDDSDVRHELESFGYADLFDGGIYGSVGDTARDPKRLVVEKAKAYITEKTGSFTRGDGVVFGDGPVEMREGRSAHFLTVGLVSDEKQRYGLNIKKRERLILAGADLLIPDYSWAPHLAAHLGWK
jgi:phosphoglycolate phosphatase-like HAD superfamily hydrolase